MMSAPRYILSRKELQETGSEQKSYNEPELDRVPARRAISDDAASWSVRTWNEHARHLFHRPFSRVDLKNPIGPLGVFGAAVLNVRPRRLADVDETAIPALEPPLMLVHIGDHEVHELDMCTRSRGRGTPGLPSWLAVVDGVDDDIVAEPQVLLRDRTRSLVRSDADPPPRGQTAGKDRFLDRIGGQVDRPRTRCDDLGHAGLPDAGKTR